MGSPITWPAWPDSITVEPDPATMDSLSTIRFHAIGHYAAADDVDLTPYVFWSSSDESVAVINTMIFDVVWSGHAGTTGLATAVTPGTTTITANLVALYFVPAWEDDPPGLHLLASAELTVTEAEEHPEPEGRFLLAFGGGTLDPDPVWTALDATPNLVTSYTIDRGRVYELDRVDTGRATVQVIDPDGILDPTNPSGPYYGQIQPLTQAMISRHNPITDEWNIRYRGFVEDYDYTVDPSQTLNRLTVTLVDLFEVLSAFELHPGQAGITPPEESRGQVFYHAQSVYGRIFDVLRDFGLPSRFEAMAHDNVVALQDTVYSPTGESALSAIQEAADGEFPGVSQVLVDRKGRLCHRGRRSKFHPDTVAAELGAAVWDYHEWKAGDGTAVEADGTDETVQVREFGFQRGLSKIINSASATPQGIEDENIAGQLIVDTTSIGTYGIRSWSADGLLTAGSWDDVRGPLTECRLFATHYVTNYKTPRDRVTTIGFRPLHPDDPRAPALWHFLNRVDLGDSVEVTVAAAGGGGFTSELYFVEGIHEDVQPLAPTYDNVTVRLDLSPRAYYAVDPWEDL